MDELPLGDFPIENMLHEEEILQWNGVEIRIQKEEWYAKQFGHVFFLNGCWKVSNYYGYFPLDIFKWDK